MRFTIVLLILLSTRVCCYCQINLSGALSATGLQKAASDGIRSVSDQSVSLVQKKYEKLSASVEKQSAKMLSRLQKKEEKLRKKLAKTDSLKAAQLFGGMEDKYATLQSKLAQPYDSAKTFPLKEYIPGVDSLQTALSFLKSANVNLPPEKLQAIGKAGDELKGLQDKLQKANEIENFVKERERQIKEQLQNTGLAKSLKSINKEAFYYSQRLREYKDALKSPEKMEEKLLGAVRNSKLFESFMKKHSYLSKLFPTPENYGTSQALAGLQTRAGVQQMLQQRFGGAGSAEPAAIGGQLPPGSGAGMGSAASYLQGQMSAAQSQLGVLKDKISKLGMSGGNSDMTMPDFKPNSQHTKSFLKRIEYGINVQSERARTIIPATSEVALMLGYKLNDKSVIGIGASYRVGWGHEGLRHIRISNEGIGLRSYVDVKAKGSLWLTGGYEMNYMQSFAKYQELYNINVWQRSGLIGLTKKYKVGKKENSMQVLWDFLSYGQVPSTQAIKFRVGFGL